MPLSKQVSDLKKFVQAVSACEVWSSRAREGITARLEAVLDGAAPPLDAPALIGSVLARARLAVAEAEQADERHAMEQADDAAVRRERDAASAAVWDRMVAIRRSVVGNYGADASGALGLDQETPEDAEQLRRFATKFVATVTEPGFTMPEPLPEGGAVDPARWLAMLRPALERLGTALEAVAVDARENAQTLADKRRALDAAREEARHAANLLSALFAYAGLADLAEKIRPTARRARGEEAPPEVPPPPNIST